MSSSRILSKITDEKSTVHRIVVSDGKFTVTHKGTTIEGNGRHVSVVGDAVIVDGKDVSADSKAILSTKKALLPSYQIMDEKYWQLGGEKGILQIKVNPIHKKVLSLFINLVKGDLDKYFPKISVDVGIPRHMFEMETASNDVIKLSVTHLALSQINNFFIKLKELINTKASNMTKGWKRSNDQINPQLNLSFCNFSSFEKQLEENVLFENDKVSGLYCASVLNELFHLMGVQKSVCSVEWLADFCRPVKGYIIGKEAKTRSLLNSIVPHVEAITQEFYCQENPTLEKEAVSVAFKVKS